MKVGVYLNTTTGGADYHKQIWVKAFAEGINNITPGLAEVLDRQSVSFDYDYSFCFSYQSEVYRRNNKMSLLRRALQEKHVEDGKIFFMDSDVLISYQGQYEGGNKTYELMFDNNCPKQFKCVYNPNSKEPNIDNVMDSLNSIGK